MLRTRLKRYMHIWYRASEVCLKKACKQGDRKLLIMQQNWPYHAAIHQIKCTKQVDIIIVHICHMLPTTITACMTVS